MEVFDSGQLGPGLAGRVALISGGAQGIGRAIAKRLQQEGVRILLLDCDAKTGEATARDLNRSQPSVPVRFLLADLLQPDQIRQAVETVRKDYSHVDILVNNAGVEIEKSFADHTLADWDKILGVNLRGAFLLTQAVLPLVPARGGAILNISSIHATHAFPGSIAYACSKAALIAMTRNLALELAPLQIRVNSICPGYIDTRLWDEYIKSSANPQVLAEQTTALHPIGRRGLPGDIADAALFLLSDNASFITGSDLVVDGGLTVRAHP
jgi:NAD(P)-dependent dehydrogenase (short-subunit alcohol dehydrogenase family)